MGVNDDDVRCAAVINGDIDRATRYDLERIWRWVIALLNDDQAAAEDVQRQIGDCPNCLRAVAGGAVGVLSGEMRARGLDAALWTAEHLLVEILSASDIFTTDPPPDGFALQE